MRRLSSSSDLDPLQVLQSVSCGSCSVSEALSQIFCSGNLTKRLKSASDGDWSPKQFCTLKGAVLECYESKAGYTDGIAAEGTFLVRGWRDWADEFNSNYSRGLIIDTEGNEVVIARCDDQREAAKWGVALRAVAALLKVKEEALADGCNSDEEGLVDVEPAYLVQRDELFKSHELLSGGRAIFQVDKTELKRFGGGDLEAAADVVFKTGDVYVICKSEEDEDGRLTRTLYYWVGAKAAMDKATVASIKAVELRRGLGGTCAIVREDEGNESDDFLWIFGGEFRVEEGKSTEGTLHRVIRWSDMPPLMYIVLPRSPRGFLASRVPFSAGQLKDSGVCVVDDRNGTVYLWQGRSCSFKHRGYGIEAATCLKADTPKGAQVVIMRQGEETEEFSTLLKEQAAQVVDPAPPAFLQNSAALFRVSNTAGSSSLSTPCGRVSLRLSLVAKLNASHLAATIGQDLKAEFDEPPALSMLQPGAAFILDCFTEMFVWYGDTAERSVRLGAVKVANQMLKAVESRPNWVDEVLHIRGGKEPFLFRIKFTDFGSSNSAVQQAGLPFNFFRNVRTIVQDEVGGSKADKATAAVVSVLVDGANKSAPPRTAGDVAVDEAGAGGDGGGGELLVWRVQRRGLVPLPDEELGHFSAWNSYVLLYGFDETASGPDAETDADKSRSRASIMSSIRQSMTPSSAPSGAGRSRSSEGGNMLSSDDEGEEGCEDEGNNDEEEEEEEEEVHSFEEPSFASERQHSQEEPHQKPRFLLYFWSGSHAKSSDWVHWSLAHAKKMLPEWQKVMGADIPQIRVFQGREPTHFRQIFGPTADHGRLIIHDRSWRKRDNPEQRVCLFRVQSMPGGTLQVPPTVASLNSLGVFVCVRTVLSDDEEAEEGKEYDADGEAVWFWVGKYASLSLQEQGAKALMCIMEYFCLPGDFPVDIIEEESIYGEHAQLWDDMSEGALGGECAFASWDGLFPDDFDPDNEDQMRFPRLYVTCMLEGHMTLEPLSSICQSDLKPGSMAVLDTVEATYVWRGSQAPAEFASVVTRAAGLYRDGGVRVVEVVQGNEPAEFCAHFQSWDDNLLVTNTGGLGMRGGGNSSSGGFPDVYEQRIMRLGDEGKLGDIRQLRGRVMGDEEAKRYWQGMAYSQARRNQAVTAAGLASVDVAERSRMRRGEGLKPPRGDDQPASEGPVSFAVAKERFATGAAFKHKIAARLYEPSEVLEARLESIEKGVVLLKDHPPAAVPQPPAAPVVANTSPAVPIESRGSSTAFPKALQDALNAVASGEVALAAPLPGSRPSSLPRAYREQLYQVMMDIDASAKSSQPAGILAGTTKKPLSAEKAFGVLRRTCTTGQLLPSMVEDDAEEMDRHRRSLGRNRDDEAMKTILQGFCSRLYSSRGHNSGKTITNAATLLGDKYFVFV